MDSEQPALFMQKEGRTSEKEEETVTQRETGKALEKDWAIGETRTETERDTEEGCDAETRKCV